MEEVKFRATKLFNFPPCSQKDCFPIAQCIVSSSEEDCLYILYQNSISILNITNGNSLDIQTNSTFLPFITYDPIAENPIPYVCTSKGELCKILDGTIIFEPQIVGTNPFILFDNQIIIGDKKSGLISLFDLNNQNNKKLSLNKYENFSLGMLNIFRNNGILSLTANSKFVFALTNNGKVLIFNILNGQKVSSTTVCSSNISFGMIKCDEDNYYIAFDEKNGTKIQAIRFSMDTDQILFEIRQPFINFIDVNKDNFLIMNNNEVTLHDKLNGQLIGNFLLPIDDISIFKSKYFSSNKNSEITQDSRNFRQIKKEFIPRFAHLLNNNGLLITTNSAIYHCRPILPIESYILNLKINEELTNKKMKISSNFFYASVEFARTISRQNWIEFEKNVRTTSDPTLFAYKIISQYLHCDCEEFNDLATIDLTDRIRNIIELLRINPHNNNGFQDQNNKQPMPLREFYRSSCSEVIFAYSYFSRCVYFLVMYLTYKNQTAAYSQQLRELSLLVHNYTQLSILAELGDDLPIELFESSEIKLNDFSENTNSEAAFSRVIMNLISRLSDFNNTLAVLINHNMYEKVVEIASISITPLVCYGKSLLKLKRYDEAVNFFIQNSGFLADDKELTEFVFQTLRSDNRDDLIIRIGSINSEANAAALFRAYIKEKDYDSAFNCILTTPNEPVKCDMLRVFIRVMKENKLHQRLLSYPMIKMFVNELCCYSIDTLILAVSFFREIGDLIQATQTLYLYARCLLRSPTRENLGKAFTAMNLVYYQMNTNDFKITVRDVGPQELTLDKLWRIMCRTRCCLLLDDSDDKQRNNNIHETGNSTLDKNRRLKYSTSIRDASEMPFSRLLEIAAIRNNDVFENALTGAHNEELVEIIPKLVHQKLILPLYELLSIKSISKNTLLVERALEAYIEINQVPPIFVIDKFIEKNATRLLMFGSVSRFRFKRNIIFDSILSLLKRKDVKKFFFLEPILKKLNLPEEFIQEFRI